MIFGEQNLRQKVCDLCPNLNRNKLTYSIKYTFTVQFVVKDCSYTKRAPKNRKNRNKK